jgi:Helix-turn-helix domain
MNFDFQTRQSDSPFVQLIWNTHSERAGSFISRAASNWEIVITRLRGTTSITVRGPETRASIAPCPADAEFFGIQFKLGTYMPHLPAATLVDSDVTLPRASNASFYLQGDVWQYPGFENADVFVQRLVRAGYVARDPVVEAVLNGERQYLSTRAIQYRFVRATGLSHSTISQIERARKAVALLEQGASISAAAYDAGYADQPHMTRSLKHLFGQTPAQIAAPAAA